jgi:cell division protein FtsZ
MGKKKKKKKLKKKISVKAVKSVKIRAEKKNLELDGVKKTKIRVIGIGGGAGNIVSEIASRLKAGSQPIKASFVVANTDLQALRATKRNTIRFQFGENFTRGLGAGMNVELAEEAAQTEKEKIKKLFQGQDLCILVASLGGGTGSGAGPVFAKIAKNLGIITLGVFTLPFKFEGERKLEIARDALLKLKTNLNTISILPNERIFQIIDKSTPLKEAFSSINKSLAESLQGLIEMIYLPGLINIDFADLRAILQGKGRLAFLNAVEVEGANRLAEAIKKVLVSPLYPYTIKGAKGVLFDIAGERGLSLSEVSQISKTISELVNPEAKIIFGISERKKYENKIKVTLLATGCSTKIFSEEVKKPKTSVSKKKRRQNSWPKSIRKESPAAKKIKRQPKKIKSAKSRSEIGASARGKLAKKIKIKIYQKPREEEVLPAQKPRENASTADFSAAVDELRSSSSFANTRVVDELRSSSPFANTRVVDELRSSSPFANTRVKEEIKIRKNAIQIKKETEEMEKEYMEKEKIWESPAFLRLRPKKLPFNPSQPKEENKGEI